MRGSKKTNGKKMAKKAGGKKMPPALKKALAKEEEKIMSAMPIDRSLDNPTSADVLGMGFFGQ